LVSEGLRQAAILKAEGAKQAVVLEANGRREAAFRDGEARERSAEADAKATQMVSDAISRGNVQAINYCAANNYMKKSADRAGDGVLGSTQEARRIVEPDVPDLNVRGAQYIGRIVAVEDAIVNGRGRVRVGETRCGRRKATTQQRQPGQSHGR
jgi:hypothetical protein